MFISGEFKREDLARAVLETVAFDLAHTVHLQAKTRGIEHVFFSGGFIGHQLVRDVIMNEWLRRDLTCQLSYENHVSTYIIHTMRVFKLAYTQHVRI